MAYKPKMNSKRTQLLGNFENALNSGQQLSPAAYKNYQRLNKLRNKDLYQADLANQKKQAADYQQAQDTAPQRAIGGYLGPQSNYDWNQYAKDAGIDPNSTQASYLRGLTPEDYGKATGRTDWNMGQNLAAPKNQDFQNQFGYDIGKSLKAYDPQAFQNQTGASVSDALKGYDPTQFQNDTGANLSNALKGYTAQDFQNEYGQDLKDLSTLTGVSDFQKYSGNTGWSLADQMKQFTGKDLENSPGYQFGLNQGQQALDRTAAARGGVLGGGQLKAQTQYAQDYAGTKFNDAFNQDMATKQSNLNQFNSFVGNDMARKSNLLNQYNNQQANKLNQNSQVLGQYNNMANQRLSNNQNVLGQYNNMAGQDFNNRQLGLNQYNNWWDQTSRNQNRDLENFYNLAGYKNTIGQNVLNNYQQNWNNYENQRNTYGNYLLNLAQMGQNAAGNTAGMLAGQNNAMADRFTGAASANAQNNWNGAMATNQAVQSGMNNAVGLAGMLNGKNGGKNWFSTKPMVSYGDINGPGLSTVVV